MHMTDVESTAIYTCHFTHEMTALPHTNSREERREIILPWPFESHSIPCFPSPVSICYTSEHYRTIAQYRNITNASEIIQRSYSTLSYPQKWSLCKEAQQLNKLWLIWHEIAQKKKWSCWRSEQNGQICVHSIAATIIGLRNHGYRAWNLPYAWSHLFCTPKHLMVGAVKENEKINKM